MYNEVSLHKHAFLVTLKQLDYSWYKINQAMKKHFRPLHYMFQASKTHSKQLLQWS